MQTPFGSLLPSKVSCQDEIITEVSSCLCSLDPRITVNVYVPSTNKLKKDAALEAVEELLKNLHLTNPVVVHGIECSSGVSEQPMGNETWQGATNRLNELNSHVTVECMPYFSISMENGLFLEEVQLTKNVDLFRVQQSLCYVDRTIINIQYGSALWIVDSEGVMTPREQVKQSKDTGFKETAGSFIAKKFNVNAKDWHCLFSGKDRQSIIADAIKRAFRIQPVKEVTVTKKIRTTPPPLINYNSNPIDFFTNGEVDQVIAGEMNPEKVDLERSSVIREHYGTIPQSTKPGADGKNPINSLGPVITEDLFIIYKHEGTVYSVLVWAKQDEEYKDYGWMLPGKRDRAYAKEQPDICVEDATYKLLSNLNIPRIAVKHFQTLCFFDDRIREQRMRSSGFVSLIILKEKPQFEGIKMIGVSLNTLFGMVKHEIRIAHPVNKNSTETFGLVRNHDSLIKAIFETNRFQTVIEALKIMTNSYPEIDPGYECPVCTSVIVHSKVLCSNGHSICGDCAKSVKDLCYICRSSVKRPFVNNLSLDRVIEMALPRQYKRRCEELGLEITQPWEENSLFKSDTVHSK